MDNQNYGISKVQERMPIAAQKQKLRRKIEKAHPKDGCKPAKCLVKPEAEKLPRSRGGRRTPVIKRGRVEAAENEGWGPWISSFVQTVYRIFTVHRCVHFCKMLVPIRLRMKMSRLALHALPCLRPDAIRLVRKPVLVPAGIEAEIFEHLEIAQVHRSAPATMLSWRGFSLPGIP